MMKSVTTIQYLTTIRFGFGSARLLEDELEELGIARPLVIGDRGVAQAGLIDRTLNRNRAPRFLDVPSNPTEKAVLEAVRAYRSEGCDGIVAVGGGSPIDLAKGVALLVTHDGPLATYAAIEGGVGRVTSDVAPLIAVPTTAGTGSEVGRAALLTLEDGRKLGFISPHLIPKRALCDPELTVGMPPSLTAATGMDALSHCVETFLSPRINPPADAIALDGAARVARCLERAVADGNDRKARWEMMMASLQGGLTFQKGLGAVHGLSHALGALQDLALHHGTLNAVVLPAVLRFNEGSADEKYRRLAHALGLNAEADLAEWVTNLNGRLGLPTGLRAMGVDETVMEGVVAGAVADHSTATNPRPVGAAEYTALFRDCL